MTERDVTDAVLWERAGSGDGQAFGALFRRHSTTVYNHVFRRTGSWERAEEAVSLVFLEAWRQRDRVVPDPAGLLLPWLLGVANNVIRRQSRTRLRHARLLARLPPPADHPDHAPLVDARDADQQQMRDVLAAMADLTPTEKEVIALCVWAELTYEQAAVAMGVPVGTVRSRLSRARGKLRAQKHAPGTTTGLDPEPTTKE
ncbi:MAG: RNA polymerase sigma factor [Dermatophilaceae bacterium]